MKQIIHPIVSLIILSILIMTNNSCTEKIPPPPETVRGDVVDTLHGVALPDPYRWLEDQESEETREWIDTQNVYTKGFLEQIPEIKKLETRYGQLLKVDYTGLPSQHGNRYFFSKRNADQELSVICMREGLDGEDQVLVDPHGLSEDLTTSVSMMGTSKNGDIMAYGIRKGGEDEVSINFLDVNTGEELPETMPRARYFGITFLHDLSGFYYSKFTEIGSRIYFHKMGTSFDSDELIFGEGYDPGKIIFAGLTENGKYLIVTVLYGSASDKTEVYIKKARSKKDFTTIVNDVNARFSVLNENNDQLYILSNFQAPKYKILRVYVDQLPSHPETWEELIPEGEGIIQGSSGIAGGKLLISTLENVVSKVRFFDLEGAMLKELELPSLGTVDGLSYKQDNNTLFYNFSSFHIPGTNYIYDMETGEQEEWSSYDVPINKDEIEVKQVWYESKDGTSIPMFLVHKKGLELNGKNPVYITGYGGFNVNETAEFIATAVIWAENGGVYANPSLRGGGEFGEEWHKAGMLENKQNVFDDFYAAAEWLIANNYTNPEKIACRGGSNGGLLVGAALTQRPDLYKAVVCTYPLLDMVRYHQFLVARFWVPEYGSSEDPDQFKYILDYSPYHNVNEGDAYPATMFISGDGDTRVAPLHARKMAALMQYANGANTPMLLYYDTKAGHSGGNSVTKTIEDASASLGFMVWQLGMDIKNYE
ncbi:MAG: S9 family peptidase [Bacteroidales bacterium]|nr:S9 family peptidase [Bacteroidales bacterium]